MDLKIVYATFPSVATAEAAARHLVAQRFKDLTPLLGRMGRALQGSRDFH